MLSLSEPVATWLFQLHRGSLLIFRSSIFPMEAMFWSLGERLHCMIVRMKMMALRPKRRGKEYKEINLNSVVSFSFYSSVTFCHHLIVVLLCSQVQILSGGFLPQRWIVFSCLLVSWYLCIMCFIKSSIPLLLTSLVEHACCTTFM